MEALLRGVYRGQLCHFVWRSRDNFNLRNRIVVIVESLRAFVRTIVPLGAENHGLLRGSL